MVAWDKIATSMEPALAMDTDMDPRKLVKRDVK
ncbi:hypothetical protein GE107_06515 [Cohnella sp. CFH 77786]|nr:hypothetical protein [Cohnella sp. CFH 77786]